MGAAALKDGGLVETGARGGLPRRAPTAFCAVSGVFGVASSEKLVPNQFMAQLDLFPRSKRGGKRKNAGRPAVIAGRQAHAPRPEHARRFPVHVTLKVVRDMPRLRQRHLYAVLREAFRRGGDRDTFRLVHYSVQSNHLHLLCEAEDKTALSRGMQGLAIRMARGLNRRLDRRGKVFFDRYHATALRSPFQTRRALVYVINNFLKHERSTERIAGPVDPFSSAAHFDGWRHRPPPFVRIDAGARVCAAARTWLLADGWRRHGPIRFGEAPAPS